jgi:hypothetical protein
MAGDEFVRVRATGLERELLVAVKRLYEARDRYTAALAHYDQVLAAVKAQDKTEE